MNLSRVRTRDFFKPERETDHGECRRVEPHEQVENGDVVAFPTGFGWVVSNDSLDYELRSAALLMRLQSGGLHGAAVIWRPIPQTGGE